MMTTSSTVCSTSCRRWLDTRIVLPSWLRWRRKPRSQRMPSGSRPFDGSSRSEHLRVAEERGRQAEPLAHAHAVLAGALAGRGGDAGELEQLVDPRVRDRAGVREHPRWSRPLRPGWKFVASRAAPTVDCGVGEVDVALLRRSSRCRSSEWMRPSSIRSVVVLPAPFGPRKPVIRPGSTSKLRSSTATKEPKRLVSPRISIFAPVAVAVLIGCLVVSCTDPCSPTSGEGQPPGGSGSVSGRNAGSRNERAPHTMDRS